MKIATSDHAWAKIYHLRNPLRLDELGDLIDEIWATHSHHRRERRIEPGAERLIGESAGIRQIRALIDKVGPTAASVLIGGESGTGKEVVARAVHERSGRRGDFIAVNCGAIPDNLLESELFGHERGAFTDAHARRKGQFERADGGTIFLDEIGDMPAPMQVKLLRVLQDRTVERVGGSNPIAVDVRVIAATHQDLPARIADGSFREDLYYRLNVFPIDVPPLRERRDDIPLLVDEFVRRLRARHQVSLGLSREAVDRLVEYDWPGNVRELVNLIERLSVVKAHGTITVSELPRKLRRPEDDGESVDAGPKLVSVSLKQHLSDIERKLINDALTQAGGVVARAATLLGIGRTTLVEKMRRYEIDTN